MDLLSRKDILEMFSISIWTLRRWEKLRGFPKPIKVSPAIFMYEKTAVENWISTRPIGN